jgi:hypothetical protein
VFWGIRETVKISYLRRAEKCMHNRKRLDKFNNATCNQIWTYIWTTCSSSPGKYRIFRNRERKTTASNPPPQIILWRVFTLLTHFLKYFYKVTQVFKLWTELVTELRRSKKKLWGNEYRNQAARGGIPEMDSSHFDQHNSRNVVFDNTYFFLHFAEFFCSS